MPTKKKIIEQPAASDVSGEVVTAAPDQIQKLSLYVGESHRFVTVEWFKKDGAAYATVNSKNPFPRDVKSSTPESRFRDEIEKTVFAELSAVAGDDVEIIHFRFMDEAQFAVQPG